LPGRLGPSEPAPFVKMPVTLGRAYGGQLLGEYGPVPWPNNPAGIGFYTEAKPAKDNPLPNGEAPDAHTKAWDDHPDPPGIGPYPCSWGLRMLKGIIPLPDKESFAV